MVKKRDRSEVEADVESFVQGAKEREYVAEEGGNASDAVFLQTGDCKPWAFHNRHSSWFTSEEAETLARSIEKYGQQQPGLVRMSTMVDKPSYEIIFGVRRWNACHMLGKAFHARVLPAETSDIDCAALMEDENQRSENISELERGLNYKAMVAGGVFKNQSALADHLAVSRQYVSKLLGAAAVFDEEFLNDALLVHQRHISVANCNALVRAMATHGGAGRMQRALAEATVEEKADPKSVLKLLLDSVKREPTIKRKVLLRRGSKKIAESALDQTGVLTFTVSTSDLENDSIEELLGSMKQRLEDIVNHG